MINEVPIWPVVAVGAGQCRSGRLFMAASPVDTSRGWMARAWTPSTCVAVPASETVCFPVTGLFVFLGPLPCAQSALAVHSKLVTTGPTWSSYVQQQDSHTVLLLRFAAIGRRLACSFTTIHTNGLELKGTLAPARATESCRKRCNPA